MQLLAISFSSCTLSPGKFVSNRNNHNLLLKLDSENEIVINQGKYSSILPSELTEVAGGES